VDEALDQFVGKQNPSASHQDVKQGDREGLSLGFDLHRWDILIFGQRPASLSENKSLVY
jgi:hypothetical protein